MPMKTLSEADPGMERKFSFVTVGECRLRVQHLKPDSPGNGKTLVFLHEGLGNIPMWRDFPETVCRETGLPGIVYERRGYGESDGFESPWPEDYLITEATVHLPAVLDACAIEKAVLVGHSDGGSIALIAAATHPERIAGVITEAAHIFVEAITLTGIRAALHAIETTDLKAKLARHHGKHTDRIIRRWADTWLDPDFRGWNIESFLPGITAPLLALQGMDDEYGTAAQVEGIARGVSGPVKTRLIPECGHIPHVQARKSVIDFIKEFIEDLPAAAPPKRPS
jgi:pimeloyl-ACP methyl ester carboxylesterase